MTGGLGHHRRHVATEAGDLLDQARADVAVGDRGHEEDRVDVRREDPVVVGQLHLGLEVADRAQAADDGRRAALAGRSRRSGRRTTATSIRSGGAPASPRASRMTAIRVSTGSSGVLRGLARTATITRSKTFAVAGDDVEVAVGDRVERARVDRDAHASSVVSPGDRRSAPSRRSGARAPMLAARCVPAGRSRQKCLATTRPPGARSGSSGSRAAVRMAGSSYGGSTMTMSMGGSAVRAGSREPGEHIGPNDRWLGRPDRFVRGWSG